MNDVPIAAPIVTEEAISRVRSLLEEGMLSDGPEVRSFESEFASYCDAETGIATTNGTTALEVALRSLGLEDGDAVITTPFSFIASANAIRLAGGVPVFADIDPETYTIDPDEVRRRCRERDDVVGILPVHLYGLPAAMDQILEIADENDLFVLEDACQAHGAAIDGTRVGSFGDATCFSFYPTKNVTTGEGGIITTDRSDVATRARRYVNHGRSTESDDSRGYEHVDLGNNYRLTSIAAAIGRVQLRRLPELNEARRETAAIYDEHFESLPVETPVEPDGYRHVYHQYTIRTTDRDALSDFLAERGIGSSVYYPVPIHRQPAYESVSTAAVDCPRSDRAAETVLSLPVHPALDEADRRRVATNVSAFYDHHSHAH